MNKLNRPLIKEQAKGLIKNKVFALFVLLIIVNFLSGSGSFGANFNLNLNLNNNGNSNNGGYQESLDDYNFNFDDTYDFDDFYEDQQNGTYQENPIESFDGSYVEQPDSFEDSLKEELNNVFSGMGTAMLGVFAGLAGVALIIKLVFAPLQVTSAGIIVSFIRRSSDQPFELGKELKGLFKRSFDSTYGKKLALVLLRSIFTSLLMLLFIVPGVIYYYSTYFAYQLMCDNPELSPMEALRLSKKMNKGNRGELFALDLSFIGWVLLVAITFGIAGIYALPYIATTDALYYENFRLRAIGDGRISADEVTPSNQGMDGADGNYFHQAYDYYTPQGNAQQPYYQQPTQPYANTDTGAYYQTPVQPEQPPVDTPPTENFNNEI